MSQLHLVEYQIKIHVVIAISPHYSALPLLRMIFFLGIPSNLSPSLCKFNELNWKPGQLLQIKVKNSLPWNGGIICSSTLQEWILVRKPLHFSLSLKPPRLDRFLQFSAILPCIICFVFSGLTVSTLISYNQKVLKISGQCLVSSTIKSNFILQYNLVCFSHSLVSTV